MKYVRHEVRGADGWSPRGTEELYDLVRDPAEHIDLAGRGSEAIKEGRKLFEALEAAYARPPGGTGDAPGDQGVEEDLHLDRGMDPEVEQLLREWGYL